MHKAYCFFDTEHAETYPQLAAVAVALESQETTIDEVQRVLDEDGKVRPDASKELLRLSGELAGKRRQIDQTFQKVLRQYYE